MTDRATAIADNEIVVTRTFDAPPELVFAAFTDAQHIGRWWGPRGFGTTTHEKDVRPGGVWRFTMHGPDGTDYENYITYSVVESPRRLAYEHGSAQHAPGSFHAEVIFEPVDGGTEVTLRLILDSPELRAAMERFGAPEGAQQTLARLDEHLFTRELPAETHTLVITRELDAPAELVYELWTQAEHLMRWMGPQGFTAPHYELDARPGGSYRGCIVSDSYGELWFDGTFHELVPPERVVFSFAWDKPGQPRRDTQITVELRALPGRRTQMTFRQAPFVDATDRDNHSEGWSSAFEKLAAVSAELAAARAT